MEIKVTREHSSTKIEFSDDIKTFIWQWLDIQSAKTKLQMAKMKDQAQAKAEIRVRGQAWARKQAKDLEEDQIQEDDRAGLMPSAQARKQAEAKVIAAISDKKKVDAVEKESVRKDDKALADEAKIEESIKKADEALAAVEKAEAEAKAKEESETVAKASMIVPDNKAFSTLGLNSMASVLSVPENINEFRAAAFARTAQKKYGKVVFELAESMHPEAFKGIKKDPILLVSFVDRVIHEQWAEKQDDDNIPFC
jgi:hypothetical protein